MTSRNFDLRATELEKQTMLLEASAGTGKTYTITGIVLRLLLEKKVDRLSKVLVVTFTRAATQELKTRMQKALKNALRAFEEGKSSDPFLQSLVEAHREDGETCMRAALGQTDELSIATIHSFCKRVLDECAFASAMPFRSEFVDDELPLLVTAAQDAVRLEVQTRCELVAAIAIEQELLPEHLLAPYRSFRRYQDTLLLPQPRALDEVLAEMREALASLRSLAEADDLPREIFAKIMWVAAGRDCELGLFGDRLVDELRTRMLGTVPPLSCYRLLARRKFATLISKRPPPPPLDHSLFELCSRYEAAESEAAHALRATLFQRIDERLALQKRADNTLSYHDLLTELDAALADPARQKAVQQSIQKRFAYAIIDEFQDTDPLQYRVFQNCFRGSGLYLVGDPKQSIYAFRGADVHAYLAARTDAGERTHTLGHNHRSHPDLIRAVATLFRSASAFADPGIDLKHVEAAIPAEKLATEGFSGAVLQLRCIDTSAATSKRKDVLQSAIAVDVATECARLLRSERARLVRDSTGQRLQARDLAVLTRSNDEARHVQDELRRRGVHSAIGRAGDVFDCPEMDDVLCLLHALGTASQLRYLRAAFTTPLFGASQEDLLAMDQDLDEQQRWLSRCEDYRRSWTKHGVLAMFFLLLANENVRQRLLQQADGERKLTNYLQIAELLHHAEHTHHRRGESLTQWLLHERDHRQAIDQDLKELRLESDADAVQILTSHGSKGLQFEIVFVPFAWAGRRAPNRSTPLLVRRPDGRHELDFRTDEDDRRENLERYLREQLCEDLRLLYVALTRARRRCYLYTGASTYGHTSGLGWLLLGPGRNHTDLSTFDFAAWRKGEKAPIEHWVAAAERMHGESEGTIDCDRIVARLDSAREPATEPPPRTMAIPRPLPERIAEGFRTTSFTALCAVDRAAANQTLLAADGIVLDEPDAPTPTATEASPSTATGMFAFARGAAAGTCLHELLEHADLKSDDHDLLPLVRSTLREHGLENPAAHRAPIDAVAETAAMLRTLRTTVLADFGFCLQDLSPTNRAAEWRFQARADRLVPNDLADLFATHANAPLQAYADRLRTLSPRAIDGYLTGSLDLLAEHDGRYFVFDWKSNWLGDHDTDYGCDALLLDVQQNDYVLQYHLYVLAVHRHLRARLMDYDYDTHIGGACYVYLRGLGDGSGSTGVFCDRPPRALVHALDAWLDGGRR
ncbi:MAG: exodeoxyribonuclease V subunit beta [Planctomycetota bacterium]